MLVLRLIGERGNGVLVVDVQCDHVDHARRSRPRRVNAARARSRATPRAGRARAGTPVAGPRPAARPAPACAVRRRRPSRCHRVASSWLACCGRRSRARRRRSTSPASTRRSMTGPVVVRNAMPAASVMLRTVRSPFVCTCRASTCGVEKRRQVPARTRAPICSPGCCPGPQESFFISLSPPSDHVPDRHASPPARR